MTEHHGPDGSNDIKLFFTVLSWTAQVKVWAGLVSPEASHLGFQWLLITASSGEFLGGFPTLGHQELLSHT